MNTYKIINQTIIKELNDNINAMQKKSSINGIASVGVIDIFVKYIYRFCLYVSIFSKSYIISINYVLFTYCLRY